MQIRIMHIHETIIYNNDNYNNIWNNNDMIIICEIILL